MVDGPKGWQFQLNPVRAVPESSQIFELAKSSELRSVAFRIVKGLASVLDASLKGWTPLHVWLLEIRESQQALTYDLVCSSCHVEEGESTM